MHALMEIQRSEAYEDKDTRLSSQTQHSVLFHEKKPIRITVSTLLKL